jgi:uncharacterized membrane-anchored protein YjiN (DUF445 family)
MAAVNIDMGAFIAAQALAQISQEDRDKLIQDAIGSILDSENIKALMKEEALKIARSEVQRLIQEDTDVRQRLVAMVNGTFAKMLADEEGLKDKLAQGLVNSLLKEY